MADQYELAELRADSNKRGGAGFRNALRYTSAIRRAGSIIGSGSYNSASGTSTDTGNYITVNSQVLNIPITQGTLRVTWYTQYSHTVANALVDIAVRLYADAGGVSSNFATERHRNICLPTANQFFAIGITASFDLNWLAGGKVVGGSGSAGPGWFQPGHHGIYLFAGLNTAGTLTWAESNSTQSYDIDLLPQGNLVFS